MPQPAYPPAEQPPVVIINQYFRPEDAPRTAPPAVEEPQLTSAPPPASPQDDNAPLFLIAMKDHSVYTARAYWIENGTLNYITTQGSQNSVSMDLVDRDLSRRLNRERNVAFGLPEN
jgi:hypothetical protein